MMLSMLIPTVEGREQLLENLIYRLLGNKNVVVKDETINTINIYIHGNYVSYPVEILIERDNKEKSIGAKRQSLLTRSKGEYVVFIDDDDDVSNDYISQIVEAASKAPDSIGFKIECMINHKGPYLASASNVWQDWEENKGGFKYVRTPYQKTPIKREIALQIGYNDMRYGEDYDYSKRLKQSGLVKSEIFIDKILYYYTYIYQDPKIKYGLKD